MKSQIADRGWQFRDWWQRLIGLDSGRHEPGFLGPLPYILILRYFVAGAVALRFWLHKPEYNDFEWHARLLVFGLIAVATVTATYVTFFRFEWRRSQVLQVSFILADIGVISAAYGLTNNPESDFFLLYYLPVFAAAEYLDWGGTASICCGIAVAMSLVVFSMHPAPKPPWTPLALVARVLVPRGAFIVVVVVSSAFVFKILSRRRAELRLVLDSLHSAAAAIPDVQALDEELESILSELVEKLNFEFAAISLVDEYRNCIETVRGRNISLGWIKRAKHDLNVMDIQTNVVKTGIAKTVVGWDPLLDKEIYERFEHWRLARVWAPIVSADGEVIGTIEAGCDKDRQQAVLTNAAIERVKQIGIEKGEEISKRRPHILLQGIAKHAIRLIGADSATLHVYRHNASDSVQPQTAEWGELILAAGAGKITSTSMRTIGPRTAGRGRTALRTEEAQWIDDPQQFEADYPELYKLGMKALAVIPLKLGSDTDGLLGIHFWQRSKRITRRELDLAETFAREMEGVIYNYLLLRRATEAGSTAWALLGLQRLMQSLASPFSLADLLKKITRNALLTLDASNVALYRYHANDNRFYSPPVVDGHFLDPASTESGVSRDLKLFQLKEHGKSQYIVDVFSHSVLSAFNRDGQARFIDREAVKSCAVLVLRAGEEGEIVGLMFVNFRETREFTAAEKRAMDALTTSAALAVKTARLHQVDLTRQLEAMREVHAAIAEKGPDLEQVLRRLLQQTLRLTGAKYGTCMQHQEHTGRLEPLARWPVLEDSRIEPQKLEQGIVGLAAKSKRSILVEDVKDHKKSMFVDTLGQVFPADWYKEVYADTRCELAVPLLDEGRLLGVLNIEHPRAGALTQEDRALLEALAVPAVIAFHTVETYKQLGRRVKHLTALKIIAARMQLRPYTLDTVIRMFLTGVTAEAGLAFSRAMLFFADEGGRTLWGRAALGAATRVEAERTWKELKEDKTITGDLDCLLQRAAQFTDDVREGRMADQSPLARRVREISIDLGGTTGAVASCLMTGKSETIALNQPDPIREKFRKLTEPDDLQHAIACVPLIGKQKKQLGVLVVDNRFLEKEREIEKEDIAGLEAFAGLLALSIENVRLQESLAEEKRIENWKEVTGFLAHSVGTVLFEVKGDINTLSTRLSASQVDRQEANGFVVDLAKGISRAERVLLEFRQFADPTPLEAEEQDLCRILREVFDSRHGGCPIEISLPSPLPVLVDAPKLSNALRELRKNSLEAMTGTNDRPLLIRVTARVQHDDFRKRHVRIEITDNGPGIPEPVLKNIFKLGMTTKEEGTGLGLPLVKSVIERHGGSIEADNSLDSGARFIICLPMIATEERMEQRSA